MNTAVRKALKMEEREKMKFLRDKIEALDNQILQLLNNRAEIVLEVGKVKSKNHLNFYDPKREKEILHRLASQNPGPFPQHAISPVFHEIISGCRSLEVNLEVVYLGPEATNTHLACLEHFGSSIQALPKEGIPDVFESVEKGEASFGVVPVENTTEGSVSRTLDMLMESEVKICGEIMMRVSHDLLSLSGKPEDIRKIYSHPQALGQSRKWLRKNYPSVPLIETASTAKAAQMAAEDSSGGAIASSFAARLYGLKVVKSQIEDYFHNYTRFLVLGRQGAERTGKDKTSILFSISHAPGTLYEVLKHFSERGINLTKIESRPVRDRAWEYVFFIDFEGHVKDESIAGLLTELEKKALFLRFLGSYPRNLQGGGER
jgi:chorismate mutase/prephenate dehydratase